MAGKAFTGKLPADVVPPGEDGQQATVSQKFAAWYPSLMAKDIMAVGLKRLLCHDGVCDTFKKVICVKCQDAVDEMNKIKLTLDTNGVKKCIKGAVDSSGAVVAAKACQFDDSANRDKNMF